MEVKVLGLNLGRSLQAWNQRTLQGLTEISRLKFASKLQGLKKKKNVLVGITWRA